MTPAFIRKEKRVRYIFSATRPLTSLSHVFHMASLIIFGISQVQDHAAITIVQSVDMLFVFSSFLSRRQVVTSFLARNAKGIFQKQQQRLEKQTIKPRQLSKYCSFLLISESAMPWFCKAMMLLEELKKTLNFISQEQDKIFKTNNIQIQCSFDGMPSRKFPIKIWVHLALSQ